MSSVHREGRVGLVESSSTCGAGMRKGGVEAEFSANCNHGIGDALVLGTNLVKEESTLIAAYDDNEGVTAAFNLNVLNRLNNELGADFNPAGFQHRARWNPVESRIEMHLESMRDQYVQIASAELEHHFRNGETIHTENSYKFTDDTLDALL